MYKSHPHPTPTFITLLLLKNFVAKFVVTSANSLSCSSGLISTSNYLSPATGTTKVFEASSKILL